MALKLNLGPFQYIKKISLPKNKVYSGQFNYNLFHNSGGWARLVYYPHSAMYSAGWRHQLYPDDEPLPPWFWDDPQQSMGGPITRDPITRYSSQLYTLRLNLDITAAQFLKIKNLCIPGDTFATDVTPLYTVHKIAPDGSKIFLTYGDIKRATSEEWIGLTGHPTGLIDTEGFGLTNNPGIFFKTSYSFMDTNWTFPTGIVRENYPPFENLPINPSYTHSFYGPCMPRNTNIPINSPVVVTIYPKISWTRDYYKGMAEFDKTYPKDSDGCYLGYPGCQNIWNMMQFPQINSLYSGYQSYSSLG